MMKVRLGWNAVRCRTNVKHLEIRHIIWSFQIENYNSIQCGDINAFLAKRPGVRDINWWWYALKHLTPLA